jgi:hypothetical protein
VPQHRWRWRPQPHPTRRNAGRRGDRPNAVGRSGPPTSARHRKSRQRNARWRLVFRGSLCAGLRPPRGTLP